MENNETHIPKSGEIGFAADKPTDEYATLLGIVSAVIFGRDCKISFTEFGKPTRLVENSKEGKSGEAVTSGARNTGDDAAKSVDVGKDGEAGLCHHIDYRRYETLCREGELHSLTTVLAYALADKCDVPCKVRSYLTSSLTKYSIQQAKQDFAYNQIAGAFRAAGVRFAPMKGCVLRRFYPEEILRTSSDVDIFCDDKKTDANAVSTDVRSLIDGIMKSLGFSYNDKNANHVSYVRERSINVEIHYNLMLQLPEIDRYYADIWSRLERASGSEYRFSDEDFYIYQTIHTFKHFLSGGTGIRSIADIAVYLSAKPNLDRTYIYSELRKLGLETFCRKCEELSTVWFGGQAKNKSAETTSLTDLCEPSNIQDFAKFIKRSGTFGLYENDAAAKGIQRGGKNTRAAKFNYALLRAFPRASYMSKRYEIVRKYPIALPFAYIYRLINAFIFKRDEVKRSAANVAAINGGSIKEISALFDSLGIEKRYY